MNEAGWIDIHEIYGTVGSILSALAFWTDSILVGVNELVIFYPRTREEQLWTCLECSDDYSKTSRLMLSFRPFKTKWTSKSQLREKEKRLTLRKTFLLFVLSEHFLVFSWRQYLRLCHGSGSFRFRRRLWIWQVSTVSEVAEYHFVLSASFCTCPVRKWGTLMGLAHP